MNYLVHLYLAGSDPQMQLGGLMGDFVKGPIPSHYPEKIAMGIYLHRRIDTLSQNSSHTRNSRHLLHPRYGHGRGIIVDIFYDHFLAAHWNEFHPTPLSTYSQDIYALLKENSEKLPPGLAKIIPSMSEHNWLYSYRHREIVGRALNRIAQRLSKPLHLDQAVEDLSLHEANLFNNFKAFITEAKAFSCKETGCNLYPRPNR